MISCITITLKNGEMLTAKNVEYIHFNGDEVASKKDTGGKLRLLFERGSYTCDLDEIEYIGFSFEQKDITFIAIAGRSSQHENI